MKTVGCIYRCLSFSPLYSEATEDYNTEIPAPSVGHVTRFIFVRKMREIAGKPFISLIPETHTIASYICSYFCSDGVTLAALACRYTYTDEMTSWRSDEEKPAIWCRGRKWSARSGSGNPTGPSERERRAMGRWRAERRRPVSRFT